METFIQKAVKEHDNACEEKEIAWEKDSSESSPGTFKIKDASTICPVCGKRFLPAVQHSYKHYKTKAKVCTYSCSLRSEREYLNGSNTRRLTLRERIELEEAEERAKEKEKLAKQRAAIEGLGDQSICSASKKHTPKRPRKQRPLTLETLNA